MAGPVSQKDGVWTASGTVDAHGATAPVTLVLDSLSVSGNTLTMRAHAGVDRYAHGITAGKGMAGRWLNLTIDTVAVRS